MFRKNKTHALFNAVDDSRIVVYNFRLRTTQAFESYRTVEYRLYHKLEETVMMPKLEEHLSRLLAGDVDDGNGNMLDAIIFGAAEEAASDLKRQHCNHSDMLRRLIIRHKADNQDIKMIIGDRTAEYEAIKLDYDKACKMLERENKEVQS